MSQAANEGLTVESPYLAPLEDSEGDLEVRVGKNIAKANPATYHFTITIEHEIPKGLKMLEFFVPPGVSANQITDEDQTVVTSGLQIIACSITNSDNVERECMKDDWSNAEYDNTYDDTHYPGGVREK